MRCLNCKHIGIKLEDRVCGECNASLDAMFANMLEPGKLLDNKKYKIEYPLGRGGFGITYRAIHQQFNRAVAIKEFYPQDIAERETVIGKVSVPHDCNVAYNRGLERFIVEGQTLLELKHPNIVTVRDCFRELGDCLFSDGAGRRRNSQRRD